MRTNHTGEEILKRLKALPEPIIPEDGQRYYYVSEFYTVDTYIFSNKSPLDLHHLDHRNTFATLEDAQQHAMFYKWLFSQPKLTLAECWKTACYDDELAPDEACAKHFIQLAKENGHL